MRKSLTTIILGLLLILIALLTYKTYLSFYLFVYGFIAILDTIFFLKEYFNKKVYLTLICSFFIGILILYASPLFPNNIIIHNIYLVNGVSTLSINTFVIGTLLLILILVGSIRKMEKYKKALDSYNRNLKLEPENLLILYNKGKALAELEEYKKAIKTYDKVLSIYPNNIDALNSKGKALTELEEFNSALEVYDQILRINPENINALYSKFFILKFLGMDNDACECFDKAVVLEHKNNDCLKGESHKNKKVKTSLGNNISR
jgi:tetratricopeptide (TPR) repeat protein